MTDTLRARPQARHLIGMSGFSATGDGVTRTILPLAAAAAPEAGLVVGIVQTAARLPWLAVSLPAGRAVDRRGAGPVLTLGLILKIIGLVLVAIAVVGPWWWLLAVAAVVAVSGEVLFETAAQVSVVHDYPEADRPRTNSTLQAVQLSLGQFVGPTIAGLAWQWHALASLASAFAAQSGAIFSRRRWWRGRASGAPPSRPPGDSGPTWSLGARALWSTPALRSTTVIGTVSMLAYGLWTSCFVLYVTRPVGLGESGAVFGLLVGCPAIGSLAGSRIFPPLLPRLTALGGLALMVVGQFGLFLPAALGSEIWIVAAGLVAYGLGLSGWSGGVLAFRQSAVPQQIYGQVTGAYRFISWGASPIGALIGGTITARYGLPASMVVGASLVSVQLPMLLWARSLRRYRGSQP